MRLLVFILAAALDIVPAGKTFLKPLQQRDSILIADQLDYGFELEGVTEGTGLSLQDLAGMSGDTLTIVRNWQIDTLKTLKVKTPGAKGKSLSYNIRGSIRIAPFEEGHYRLPQIAVRREVAGKVDTLVFEPSEMDVTTIPIDTTTFKIHDIKGQIRYPVTFRELIPYIAGFLLLAAAVAGVVILVKRRRERAAGENLHKDPAYVVALRELDKYRGDKYWAPERQKTFYSGMTDILRFYMEDRFGVDAPEMTTAELFAALKNNPDITPDLYNETKELFETADFVKFAKFAASDEDNAKALPAAVRFVTSTYRVEVENESASDGEEAAKK